MTISRDSLVHLDYRTLNATGELFEEGQGDDAIEYVHGHGELPPGLEAALEGKDVGAELSIELTAEDAYGPHDPELILMVPRSELEDAENIAEGDTIPVELEDDDGEITGEIPMRVSEVRSDVVFLDANHPLAGQAVTFEVKVLGVRPATAEELEAVDCSCEDH